MEIMGITKKTNNNKHKGNNFERFAASKLSGVFDVRLVRVYTSGAMDMKGDLRPEVDKHGNIPKFNWIIECKNQKKYNIKQWIRQVQEEEKVNNKHGLLIFHVYGLDRNIIALRTELGEKCLYPTSVKDNIYQWVSKPIVKMRFTKIIENLAYTYDYFAKELVLDIKFDGNKYLFMNLETFATLYRKDWE
jgi:hypothetical protein